MLNPPKLIGLIGLSRSGKDTVAKYLTATYGYKQLAFATGLKAVVAKVFDIPLDDLDNEDKRNTPLPRLGNNTIREALQFVGTEGFRKFYDGTWCNYLINELHYYGYALPHTKFVVSDIRFDNELETIKRLGGITIYIDNPEILSNRFTILGVNCITQLLTQCLSTKYGHSSEFNVLRLKDKADYLVNNDIALPDLYRQIDTLITSTKDN